MQTHYDINKIYPFQYKHFNAWLTIFNETIDKYFTGEKASLTKKEQQVLHK